MALDIHIPYAVKRPFCDAVGIHLSRPKVAVSVFMADHGLTEADIRARAQSGATTINEAFRRYVVGKYPALAGVWPERQLTMKQKISLSDRAKHPDTDALKQAVYLLHATLQNPDDRKLQAKAKQFLLAYGINHEENLNELP